MKINSIEWGKIIIGDKIFKDVKLFPGGFREWDWNETGTKHSPGIQPEDLKELVDAGATQIVLSKGFESVLQTTNEAEKYMIENKIKYYILETGTAVKKYNELFENNEKVGALIHSTC